MKPEQHPTMMDLMMLAETQQQQAMMQSVLLNQTQLTDGLVRLNLETADTLKEACLELLPKDYDGITPEVMAESFEIEQARTALDALAVYLRLSRKYEGGKA